ncbi:MAG: CDP-alcohol phosphatidyltransferase family protein [Myxococcota bacterium]
MSAKTQASSVAAWAVHLLTASGAVAGLFAMIAVTQDRAERAALLMLLALAIDGVDGTFARAARVRERVPGIDGRRLDDVVDYLNYVIVPAFFLWRLGRVDDPAWLAAPVLASAFGFARVDAKTEDDFFLGFPSYWNVLAIYLWLFETPPWLANGLLVGLALAVFIPFKYLYPSKLEPPRLRRALALAGMLWGLALVVCAGWPEWARARHLPALSLLYPAWYFALSFQRGGLRRA